MCVVSMLRCQEPVDIVMYAGMVLKSNVYFIFFFCVKGLENRNNSRAKMQKEMGRYDNTPLDRNDLPRGVPWEEFCSYQRPL